MPARKRDEIVARALAEKINLRIGERHARHRAGRDHDAGDRRGGVARVRRQARLTPTIEAGAREALPAELKRASALPDPSGVPRPSLRDRAAALHAQAQRSRSRARPRDDSARLLHHEAQRDRGDDPADLAGIRQRCIRSRRASRPKAITRCSRGWNNGCATSPAMTRSRCSRIPARRANMPGCSRSAAITPRAASRIARSA